MPWPKVLNKWISQENKFPENNIIIFDFHSNYLTTQGYTINRSTTGVRCFPSSEYTTETYDIGGVNIKLSKIITETINYMVNIAYLKASFSFRCKPLPEKSLWFHS